MHATPRSLLGIVLCVGAILCLSDCGPAPILGEMVKSGALADGVYEGAFSSWPNTATVKVTVKQGRIADVTILRHWASWIGKRAEPIIPPRIIEKQSTNVDAVTGATNSSRVLMNAAQDALEKAYRSR